MTPDPNSLTLERMVLDCHRRAGWHIRQAIFWRRMRIVLLTVELGFWFCVAGLDFGHPFRFWLSFAFCGGWIEMTDYWCGLLVKSHRKIKRLWGGLAINLEQSLRAWKEICR